MPYSCIVHKPDPAVEYYEAYKNIGKKYTRIGGYSTDQPADCQQKAIDAITKGKINIREGIYKNEKAVVIGQDVKLELDEDVEIQPQGNFNVFQLKRNAKLENGKINTSALGTFNKACVLLDGADKMSFMASFRHQTMLKNVLFLGAYGAGKGTALELSLDGDGEYLSGLQFERLSFEGFEYGILIKLTNPVVGANSYITGNRFKGLTGFAVRHFIFMDRDETKGYSAMNIEGNMFEFQYSGDPTHTDEPLTIAGMRNKLVGLLWDMPAGVIRCRFVGGYDYGAKYNIAYIQGIRDRDDIVQEDGALGNQVNGMSTAWGVAYPQITPHTLLEERIATEGVDRQQSSPQVFIQSRYTAGANVEFDSRIYFKPSSTTEDLGQLGLKNIKTNATAGAITEYISVVVNGVARKMAVYALS